MFGPREVLLTSEEPVVNQFLNGRRLGPIGMSEEKDTATMAREQAHVDAGHNDGSSGEDVTGIVPQLPPTPGLPERRAVRRRKDRVMRILHTLPVPAQQAIVESLGPEDRARYSVGVPAGAPTQVIPAVGTAPLGSAPLGSAPLGSAPLRPSPTPRRYSEPPGGGFQGELPPQ
jgi:phospholipid/cholesterol/gamma-HCH transport system ATP-binding protein